MNREQIEEELAVSLAKAILDRSILTNDRVFSLVSTVSSILLPAYLAILGLHKEAVKSSPYFVILPVGLFFLAILSIVIVSFPRLAHFDFKQPELIIANHAIYVRSLRKWGWVSIVCMLGGVAGACSVLLFART